MGGPPLPAGEDIVRRLHTDDSDCLELLMMEHRERLVRYAERVLGGNECAEDVVQEVFFRLWVQRPAFQSAGSLRAYLYTSTRNAAIDERRRCARRAVAARDAHSPQRVPNPLEVATASDLAGAAETAVTALPARRREAFRLARLEGLTYREIATAMGVSEQTVANQMSHALRSVRQALANHLASSSGSWRVACRHRWTPTEDSGRYSTRRTHGAD